MPHTNLTAALTANLTEGQLAADSARCLRRAAYQADQARQVYARNLRDCIEKLQFCHDQLHAASTPVQLGGSNLVELAANRAELVANERAFWNLLEALVSEPVYQAVQAAWTPSPIA